MNRKTGRHTSGKRDYALLLVLLLAACLVGFFFLIGHLPAPWGSLVLTATVFFAASTLVCLELRKTFRDRSANPHPKTILRYRLTIAKAAICVFAAIVAPAWLFLDVPYKLFSCLNLLPFPALLALYLFFPGHFTLREKNIGSDIPLSGALFSVLLVPMLRSFEDFNLHNWLRLLYICLLPTLVLCGLYFLRSQDRKTTKSTVLVFALVSALYILAAGIQINFLLDRSRTEQQHGILTEMRIHNGYRGSDHYYLTILLDDGNTIELQTDPNHYAALTPGDSITVYTRDGALKIPYSIAE